MYPPVPRAYCLSLENEMFIIAQNKNLVLWYILAWRFILIGCYNIANVMITAEDVASATDSISFFITFLICCSGVFRFCCWLYFTRWYTDPTIHGLNYILWTFWECAHRIKSKYIHALRLNKHNDKWFLLRTLKKALILSMALDERFWGH